MTKTILIVEDHFAVRISLRDWLRAEFPQHNVLDAASAEEAIAMVGQHPPQVVVMDISLPQMNGIDATRQIRAAVPEAQVVILTIHEDDAYRTDAEDAGASAFVPKRAMQTELIPTLATLLLQDHDNGNTRKAVERQVQTT